LGVVTVASVGSNKVEPSSECHSLNPGQLVQAVSCMQETHKKTPCDLDLRPMTLIFNAVLEVVKVHVRTKFHQAKCSGS